MNDRQRDNFDFDQLLHPARAFGHPSEVINDPHLTLNEKRAILASWASDACAVETAPDLRITTSGRVVQWDDIMDALRTLDREANGHSKPLPHYKRVLVKSRTNPRATSPHSRRSGSQGQMLN
jgi:hypothetical protein